MGPYSKKESKGAGVLYSSFRSHHLIITAQQRTPNLRPDDPVFIRYVGCQQMYFCKTACAACLTT